jgi:hypothetical protein
MHSISLHLHCCLPPQVVSEEYFRQTYVNSNDYSTHKIGSANIYVCLITKRGRWYVFSKKKTSKSITSINTTTSLHLWREGRSFFIFLLLNNKWNIGERFLSWLNESMVVWFTRYIKWEKRKKHQSGFGGKRRKGKYRKEKQEKVEK